jgi:hypothetical protein
VSSPSGSFPPEGFSSLLEGVVYPVAEGGEEVEVTELGNFYPSQICDVEVWHNGAGGFYTNWSTVSNIEYSFAVFHTVTETQTPAEMPEPNLGNYFDSEVRTVSYTHDGTGYYSITTGDWGYYSNGTSVTTAFDFNEQDEVPAGSGNYYDNGKVVTYVWDGSGSITTATTGSFFANGTLITDVSQTAEVPSSSGNFYSNGKYTRYNWNGSGGYTTLTNQGSFYPNNTFIWTEYIQTEVPSGTSNYYNNGETVIYRWNGSGGYTATGGGSYYANGTYITNDGTYNYYWNGSGVYYAENM